MKAKVLLLFSLLAASLAVASPAGATPTLPVIVVNHSTRQCAEVIQGDDCGWCEPLEGWEVLGYSSGTTCPDGYEDLGYQGMTGECRAYKSQFCCSSHAHHGDCEDLVINESEHLCAFVEEIEGCTLPEGWASAGDTTQWSGRCPYEYQWVGDIACLARPEAPEPTATVRTDAATATPTVEATPLPTTPPEPSLVEYPRTGFVWVAVIALAGLLAIVVGFAFKWLRQR